jgi:hypothetical protein
MQLLIGLIVLIDASLNLKIFVYASGWSEDSKVVLIREGFQLRLMSLVMSSLQKGMLLSRS